MKGKFKKFWKWLVGLFKKTTALTVDVLLDLGIDYFMRYYNKNIKGKISAVDLLHKLELSIEKQIESSDNKFDDSFLPYVHDAFKRLTDGADSIDRIIDQFDGAIEPILRRIKKMLVKSMNDSIAREEAKK